MTTANNWSHATYLYIAAGKKLMKDTWQTDAKTTYTGCYLAADDTLNAELFFVKVKQLLDGTLKVGKELPAEAFVRKRSKLVSLNQTNH
jgi:hypothetical protein